MRAERSRFGNRRALISRTAPLRMPLRSSVIWKIAVGGCLIAGCASPEPQLRPATTDTTQHLADTARPIAPPATQQVPHAPTDILPAEYTLTDTTGWATDLEEGKRAMLRRRGVVVDTVDVTLFDVTTVGKDSLVFLRVRTASTPFRHDSATYYDSYPTAYVLWTPASQRKLSDFLPFFDDYFSSPTIQNESTIYYWGIARRDTTNRLYAMRYQFRTAHLDSVFLKREDPLATDYRYHLGLPQVLPTEVAFDSTAVDAASWRMLGKPATSSK